MNTKLTEVQKMVIDTLKNGGWELAKDNFGGFMYLQHGKIGHGGLSLTIKRKTFESLEKKRLIKTTGYNYPTERFVLAD